MTSLRNQANLFRPTTTISSSASSTVTATGVQKQISLSSSSSQINNNNNSQQQLNSNHHGEADDDENFLLEFRRGHNNNNNNNKSNSQHHLNENEDENDDEEIHFGTGEETVKNDEQAEDEEEKISEVTESSTSKQCDDDDDEDDDEKNDQNPRTPVDQLSTSSLVSGTANKISQSCNNNNNNNNNVLHTAANKPSNSSPASFQISYVPDQRSINLMKNLLVTGSIGHGISSTVLSVEPPTASTTATTSEYSSSSFAVKVIPRRIFDQTQTEFIQREFELLKLFQDHPLVVRLYSFVQDASRVLFIFEKCPTTLRSVLGKIQHRRFEHESVRKKIIFEVLSVLQLMHFRGVAYRDLKPENILVRPDGRLCLCDFGLAKKVIHDDNQDENQQLHQQHDKAPSTPLHHVSSPLSSSSSTTFYFHNNNNNNNNNSNSGKQISSSNPTTAATTPSSASSTLLRNNNSNNVVVTSTPLVVTPSRRTFGVRSTASYRNNNNNNNTPSSLSARNQSQQPQQNQKRKREFVGTCAYMAPELVNPSFKYGSSNTNKNSSSSSSFSTSAQNNVNNEHHDDELFRHDMWALGILHYELCFSRPPFVGTSYSRSEEDTLAIIANAQMNNEKIPMPEWPPLSSTERDFMFRLLKYDPAQRMTATEAMLQHPWMMTVNSNNENEHGSSLLGNLRGSFVDNNNNNISKINNKPALADYASTFTNLNNSATTTTTKKSLWEYLRPSEQQIDANDKNGQQNDDVAEADHARILPPPWMNFAEGNSTLTDAESDKTKGESTASTFNEKISLILRNLMSSTGATSNKETTEEDSSAIDVVPEEGNGISESATTAKTTIASSPPSTTANTSGNSNQRKRQRLAAAGMAVGAVPISLSPARNNKTPGATQSSTNSENENKGGFTSWLKSLF